MDEGSQGIIITGAAGGIGIATVDRIVAAGLPVRIGLLDRDEAALHRMAEQYTGDRLQIVPLLCDLHDAAAITAAIGHFVETGPIDTLFANAGVMTAPEPFEAIDLDALDRSLAINLRAITLCTLAAWPHFRKGSGHVLANTSGAGRHPLASDPVYSAAKAGAIMFVRACAQRRAETGIRFNALAPGVVDTPILLDPRTGEWRDEVRGFAAEYELIDAGEVADAAMRLIANASLNDQIVSIVNRPRTTDPSQ